MQLDINTKIIINNKEIKLPTYNEDDLKIEHPTLDDYNDFVINMNGEEFKAKILKSDWERLKNVINNG